MSAASILTVRLILIFLWLAVLTCVAVAMGASRVRIQFKQFFIWLPLFLSIISTSLFWSSLRGSYPDSTTRRIFNVIFAGAWLVSSAYHISQITYTTLPFIAVWWCKTLSCKTFAIADVCAVFIFILIVVEMDLAAMYDRRSYPDQKPVTSIFITTTSAANGTAQYIPLTHQPVLRPVAYSQQGYDQTQPLQPLAGYPYPVTTGVAYQFPVHQPTTNNTAPYHF